MADASDIEKVRKNTDEPTPDTFDDVYIGDLIDALGVAAASAEVWKEKAASYAKLVTTSEAGASRSLSDLMKNAIAMANLYTADESPIDVPTDHPISRKIVRA